MHLGGEIVAFAEYTDRGHRRLFTYAHTDPQVGGRGLGTQLVSRALQDTEEADLEVVAICSFVARVAARKGAAR